MSRTDLSLSDLDALETRHLEQRSGRIIRKERYNPKFIFTVM